MLVPRTSTVYSDEARFMPGVFHDHPLTAGLGFNHTTGYVHIAWSRASTYHLSATLSFKARIQNLVVEIIIGKLSVAV
jgi:hypothetical protein